jgi:hypothetical protein
MRHPGIYSLLSLAIRPCQGRLINVFVFSISKPFLTDVPVHISASQLQKLLQGNADDFTSRFLNATDFTVDDLNSCYEHVWTLYWTTQIGDLPNFIMVCMPIPFCSVGLVPWRNFLKKEVRII